MLDKSLLAAKGGGGGGSEGNRKPKQSMDHEIIQHLLAR